MFSTSGLRVSETGSSELKEIIAAKVQNLNFTSQYTKTPFFGNRIQ
jgi:hypothetical protein